MKRFKLVMLLAILLFGACQENNVEKLDTNSQNSQGKERLWMVKNVGGVSTRAVALKEKLWNSGDTIRIKFLNGSADLQDRVKLYADMWLKYACLHFLYVSSDSLADVKIGFDMVEKELAWSTIGTDCKLIPQDEPSTHFVYLDDPDEEFVRGEVLRAFGHILGLGFEHQNPDSPVRFKDNAQDWLMSNYGLTENEAMDIMAQYDTDQTNFMEYDKNSIMVVELSSRILENRSDVTTFNTELSEKDKVFISGIYPFSNVNLDSIVRLNIEAINEHCAKQLKGYRLEIGVNHDGGTKIPFFAQNGYDTAWFGYVSDGIVYRRVDSDFMSSLEYVGLNTCFILRDELYVTSKNTFSAGIVRVFSLENLKKLSSFTDGSIQNQRYDIPYVHGGKRFIMGGGSMLNGGNLILSIYNIDDKVESRYTLNFQKDYYDGQPIFVKDGYCYFYLNECINYNHYNIDIYKVQLGTFNSYKLVKSFSNIDYLPDFYTGCIGHDYYISSPAGKMLTIYPNDSIELKQIDEYRYIKCYANKFYQTDYRYANFYTEYIVE